MQRRWMALTGVTAIAAALAGSALAGATDGSSASRSGRDATSRTSVSCDAVSATGRRTEIATAKLFVEYNSTDQDIGVHGAFDDHGWKSLCVFDPTGRPVLEVGPRGQLLDLTMAGIFFESREPPA